MKTTTNPPPFPPSPLSQIKTNRDLLLFQLPDNNILTIACDSSGGIGPKPNDKLQVSGYILGKFTARAALMELLSAGATPACIVDALSVEANPTGEDILRGIRYEAKQAGLDPDLAVTGSTEKNIPVEQTGIGVTAVGICPKASLKIGVSKPGDVVVAVGIPSVADEVLSAEKEGKTAQIPDVLQLTNAPFIHEIIPVGSTGTNHELKALTTASNLQFKLQPQTTIDLNKSAGPATTLLTTLPKVNFETLKNLTTKPLTPIAQLL
ncbi:MAG: AIR synthase related protein [Candidatus Bathyarchaeota archaeon]|nr:AIR synthase related protein [Candidatus Bathyarchaeota archaeon]